MINIISNREITELKPNLRTIEILRLVPFSASANSRGSLDPIVSLFRIRVVVKPFPIQRLQYLDVPIRQFRIEPRIGIIHYRQRFITMLKT